ASASGSPSASSSASASPSASASGSGGTVIDLTETADLHIVDASGQPVTSIKVTKGQTYTFNITNTAGFDHDFYIGTDADLQAGTTAALTGVKAFSSGTQTFTYTFASDGPLNFGCTIPGHYQTMHGTFDIGS
ncbi:MAG: plastocyanin/azurin family copper-binding protein, partial [Candidatus Limnocylindrales bacterium]